MRELITSSALVILVAVLGFMALDNVGEPGQTARVDAAPLAAAQSAPDVTDAPALTRGQLVELPLHLLYTPDQRLSVKYDASRWYRLEYQSLTTLAHQRLSACQLELESNGEPVRVSGEWTQGQRLIGSHRFGVGALTPAESPFPRQIVYTTQDGNAYLVFTLRIGSTIASEADFLDCQGDADAVLATLRRMESR